MISQIVDPPERLREEAQELAEKIARNSPAAMRRHQEGAVGRARDGAHRGVPRRRAAPRVACGAIPTRTRARGPSPSDASRSGPTRNREGTNHDRRPRSRGRDDYSGPFDPDFRYEDLSKDALVKLVREFALIAHLLDRSIFTAIGMKYGQQAVEELAIAEWMGASPIYTERIRKAFGIEGDDVAAIFKSLQLDPGFVHQYMDVRYEVVDEKHGYFELAHCGALMDVEPFGERPVIGMCHHIEDPTFDATVSAINPKARCRPGPPSAAELRRPAAALPVGGRDRRRRGAARGARDRPPGAGHDGRHPRMAAGRARPAPTTREWSARERARDSLADLLVDGDPGALVVRAGAETLTRAELRAGRDRRARRARRRRRRRGRGGRGGAARPARDAGRPVRRLARRCGLRAAQPAPPRASTRACSRWCARRCSS